MAVDLIFSGTELSTSTDHKLRSFSTTNNELYIEIEIDGSYPSWISLDRETAIKFSKELRKQISYLEGGTR